MTGPASPRRSPTRRLLLLMVAAVFAVDALALGVYHVADLRLASATVRTGFTVTWTLVTLAVVLPLLRRIRRGSGPRHRGE